MLLTRCGLWMVVECLRSNRRRDYHNNTSGGCSPAPSIASASGTAVPRALLTGGAGELVLAACSPRIRRKAYSMLSCAADPTEHAPTVGAAAAAGPSAIKGSKVPSTGRTPGIVGTRVNFLD